MQKLSRDTLWSLEDYAARRDAFRREVMQHKKHRRVALGPHAALYFEDTLTMQYQVQEMLRAERIFEAAEIEEEIATYNPLIPDGNNWKATFMIEYADESERRAALERLTGVEHRVWTQTGDTRVFAIANEDLERSTDEKTSAVHFLRFQLPETFLSQLQRGDALSFGIDHEQMRLGVVVDEPIRQSLMSDLDL